MTVAYTILVVLFFFSLTIFVHELGHFLLARITGMKVETFSIGFGPALIQWKRKGIVYKLGMLPFGGYVALPQMDTAGERKSDDPADSETEPAQPDFPRAAPWKRILVSAAGATGNLLLALLLAWVVFQVGKPSAPHERRCVVGYVAEESPAWHAGMQIGDTITAANGETVQNWQDLLTVLSLSSAEHADLTIRRNGDTLLLPEIAVERGRAGLRIPAGIYIEELCRVGSVLSGSSADEAGLRSGDLILSLDGILLRSRPHMIDLVAQRSGATVPITVQRDGEEIELRVRPMPDPESGIVRIGIIFSDLSVDFDHIAHPRPIFQLREHATAIFRFLRALITPRESRAAAGAVGGPVLILYTYWQMVRGSLMMAVWFTVFLNVNLAVLNLLPIPVLDGGHILFALIEAVIRRPVHPAVIGWAHRIFASLLITLILLLTLRDAFRLPGLIGP